MKQRILIVEDDEIFLRPLQRTLEVSGYDVLVVANNRDDQAETVLYRLVKYASPRGLQGMRPRDGDVARPLLARGALEEIVQLAVVTHHLIRFSRDALRGAEEASFYADPSRSEGRRAVSTSPIAAHSLR